MFRRRATRPCSRAGRVERALASIPRERARAARCCFTYDDLWVWLTGQARESHERIGAHRAFVLTDLSLESEAS
jgi:hypothetical protein